jgi:hypothetical protein
MFLTLGKTVPRYKSLGALDDVEQKRGEKDKKQGR